MERLSMEFANLAFGQLTLSFAMRHELEKLSEEGAVLLRRGFSETMSSPLGISKEKYPKQKEEVGERNGLGL
jgi:hypothetical protein